MSVYQPTATIICPHCSKSLDDQADDYAVAGRTGSPSIADECCGWCDNWLRVTRKDDGTIHVVASFGPNT